MPRAPQFPIGLFNPRTPFGSVGEVLAALDQWLDETDYDSAAQLIHILSAIRGPDWQRGPGGNVLTATALKDQTTAILRYAMFPKASSSNLRLLYCTTRGRWADHRAEAGAFSEHFADHIEMAAHELIKLGRLRTA